MLYVNARSLPLHHQHHFFSCWMLFLCSARLFVTISFVVACWDFSFGMTFSSVSHSMYISVYAIFFTYFSFSHCYKLKKTLKRKPFWSEKCMAERVSSIKNEKSNIFFYKNTVCFVVIYLCIHTRFFAK